jgi:GH43 family beta-xylosidase
MLGQMKANPGDTSAFSNFSLDMTYFECNGVSYIAWAQIKTNSSIFIATIDPKDPQQLTSDAVLLSAPDFAWEWEGSTLVNEGPAVIRKNGKIYLCFSAAAVDKSYCIGMLSADVTADLTDNSVWIKNTYPLLCTEDLLDQYGPGHNSFTTDEYDNPILVYHARPEECAEGKCEYSSYSDLNDPCRHARVKQIFFDSEGAPVLNLSEEEVLSSKFRTVTITIVVSESDR